MPMGGGGAGGFDNEWPCLCLTVSTVADSDRGVCVGGQLLIQKADIGGWVENKKQRVLHKLGIQRKVVKTVAQRRAEMRENLRDLIIHIDATEAPEHRPPMIEEGAGLRVGGANQVLSRLPMIMPSKYDEDAGVRRPEEDPYKRDPTEVEFSTLRRMTRHVALLEANVHRLIVDQNSGVTDELAENVEDFRALLEQMRLDAEILSDNAPQGENQDLVEDLAQANIDRLCELLDKILQNASPEPEVPGALPPVPNLRASIEEEEMSGSGATTPTLDSPRDQAAAFVPERVKERSIYAGGQAGVSGSQPLALPAPLAPEAISVAIP
eukprot:3085910-Rhodomonas_salina.1